MNNLNKKILLIGLGCLTAAAGYASAPGGPQTAPRKKTSRQFFTSEEDVSLRALVAQHGTSDWERIASAMPDRDVQQCRNRWYNYLTPRIGHYASAPGGPQTALQKKTSRQIFTSEEDEHLRALVAQHGTNWQEIASSLPGRNARQCQNRWYNYLSPGTGPAGWTEEEDNLLREKVSRLGPKWTRIAAFFPGRTDTSIRNRWELLQRRDKKQQPAQPPPQTQRQPPQTDDDPFWDDLIRFDGFSEYAPFRGSPFRSDSGSDGPSDFDALFWWLID
jgi:3-oxoacyl-ACP reductase-like protein